MDVGGKKMSRGDKQQLTQQKDKFQIVQRQYVNFKTGPIQKDERQEKVGVTVDRVRTTMWGSSRPQ